MKSKKRHLLILMFIYSVASCTFSNINFNSTEDSKEGRLYLDNLYGKIQAEKFEEIDNMVADSLKVIIGRDGISKMLKFIGRKMGSYKSYVVDDSLVKSLTGSFNETFFNYKVTVIYDSGSVKETLGFRKQDNSEIKIFGFYANSDVLMK